MTQTFFEICVETNQPTDRPTNIPFPRCFVVVAFIKAPAISTYSYSLTVILDHHEYVFKVQEQDYNEPSRMYVALTNLIRK